MDDWVDPNLQEPGFKQHPGHAPASHDLHPAPDAAEGPDCLSHTSSLQTSTHLQQSATDASSAMIACIINNAVIEPAELLAKIRAFLLEFSEELFQRNRVLDIPVVMICHLWFVTHR